MVVSIKKFQLLPAGGYAVMSLSPDGKICSGFRLSCVADLGNFCARGTAKLDIATDGFRKSVFSKDSRTLAIGDQSGKITVIDLVTKKRRESAVKPYVSSLTFNSKGNMIAVGQFDGAIELRATDDPTRLMGEFATSTRMLHDIAFGPDGTVLYVSTAGDVWTWRLDSGRPETTLAGKSAEDQIYFTKNGWYSWRASTKGIQVISWADGGKVEDRSVALSFPEAFLSEDGQQFAFSNGENVAVGAVKSSMIRVVGHVRHPPFGVRFSPNGLWLATNATDGQSELVLFDLSKSARGNGVNLGSGTSFDFSHDSTRLVVGSSHGQLSIVNLQSMEQRILSPPDGREVTSTAFSKDNLRIAAGRITGEIESIPCNQ